MQQGFRCPPRQLHATSGVPHQEVDRQLFRRIRGIDALDGFLHGSFSMSGNRSGSSRLQQQSCQLTGFGVSAGPIIARRCASAGWSDDRLGPRTKGNRGNSGLIASVPNGTYLGSSSPRKRGSNVLHRASMPRSQWISAVAGMTNLEGICVKQVPFASVPFVRGSGTGCGRAPVARVFEKPGARRFGAKRPIRFGNRRIQPDLSHHPYGRLSAVAYTRARGIALLVECRDSHAVLAAKPLPSAC